MESLITLLDTPGAKGFFQSPSYLLGVPLLILGALGVLIALTPVELRWPQPTPSPEAETHLAPGAEGHPSAGTYIQIGLILGVITLVEVFVYYINFATGALLGILLTLSGMKFLLVLLFFMHLRFDSRLFSYLFFGAMLLVVLLFAVVLGTLGASLI